MSIKQIQINIKKEYYDLVPRPLDSQYKSLRESIRDDGQHIPIVVNQEGTILDGHTRYEICKELKIEPIYETKTFASAAVSITDDLGTLYCAEFCKQLFQVRT